MSLPLYPNYKDSGVEWLGEVPGHWGASPLKAVATHNDDVLDETTAPDSEIVYVDISSVDPINGITAKETMLFSAAPSRARRRVQHGDVIVSTVRTYLRAIARVRDPEDNLVVSTGFAVVRPGGKLVPDFLGYIVSASYFVEQVIARSTGVSYPAINASELVAIPVAVPSLPEQIQIAAFLDRETAKIDELVAEQRRLMALLKEKRQAVISHAVTRGLNPDAPLKPSGIEWLGDVPEHWEITRVKYHCTVNGRIGFRGYTTEDQVEEGNGALVLGATHITQAGAINLSAPIYLSWEKYYESPEIMVEPTHILVVQRGSTCGKVGFVSDDIGAATINPSLVLLKDIGCVGRLMFYFLSSDLIQGMFQRVLGSTAIPMLSQEQIGNIPFLLPPVDEQEALIAVLEKDLGTLDTLTTEAQRAIDLLQERRTALISAAVTGQIDVREAI